MKLKKFLKIRTSNKTFEFGFVFRPFDIRYSFVNSEGSLQLVRPEKSFSDFSEIWYLHRGWWLMHDGMLYDPIQDQGQGHEWLKATQEESSVIPTWD